MSLIAKPSRPPIDWEAIEREYRAGSLSIGEIARQHDISRQAILKRAKRGTWQRDLSAQVRAEVTARLVTGEVTGAAPVTDPKEAIDAAASRAVQVVREHRASIARGQRLLKSLFAELEEASDNRVDIEEAIEEETAGDKNPTRRAMMLRAVALPSRSGVLVNLSNAAKAFIGLDRQAFGLDADEGDKPFRVIRLRDIANEPLV